MLFPWLQEEGYLPETVLSFLTAQGSGFRHADTANMTLDDMIQKVQFDCDIEMMKEFESHPERL